jgi:hypothetical protein
MSVLSSVERKQVRTGQPTGTVKEVFFVIALWSRLLEASGFWSCFSLSYVDISR